MTRKEKEALYWALERTRTWEMCHLPDIIDRQAGICYKRHYEIVWDSKLQNYRWEIKVHKAKMDPALSYGGRAKDDDGCLILPMGDRWRPI